MDFHIKSLDEIMQEKRGKTSVQASGAAPSAAEAKRLAPHPSATKTTASTPAKAAASQEAFEEDDLDKHLAELEDLMGA